MITFPAGFDPAVLLADFWGLALPFVEVAALIAVFVVINKVLKRG